MIKVPTRIPKTEKVFKVKIEKINPASLKYALRQICREKCPLYFEKVELSIPVETKVEVTNFGRWLFGVKGFAGHYSQRFDEIDKEKKNVVEIFLPNIKEVFELVECGLKKLQKEGFIKIME